MLPNWLLLVKAMTLAVSNAVVLLVFLNFFFKCVT